SDADEREAPVGAGRRAIGMRRGGCGERDERQQETRAGEGLHHGWPTAARLRTAMKERVRVRPAMVALGLGQPPRANPGSASRLFRREACWPVNGARHLVIDRMKWQS